MKWLANVPQRVRHLPVRQADPRALDAFAESGPRVAENTLCTPMRLVVLSQADHQLIADRNGSHLATLGLGELDVAVTHLADRQSSASLHLQWASPFHPTHVLLVTKLALSTGARRIRNQRRPRRDFGNLRRRADAACAG
jgi:hypothetical protein